MATEADPQFDSSIDPETLDRWRRECAAILRSSASYRLVRSLASDVGYAHPELVSG